MQRLFRIRPHHTTSSKCYHVSRCDEERVTFPESHLASDARSHWKPRGTPHAIHDFLNGKGLSLAVVVTQAPLKLLTKGQLFVVAILSSRIPCL